MTKKFSRQINNLLRKKDNHIPKKKKKNKTLKNEDDHTITDCTRVENGLYMSIWKCNQINGSSSQ